MSAGRGSRKGGIRRCRDASHLGTRLQKASGQQRLRCDWPGIRVTLDACALALAVGAWCPRGGAELRHVRRTRSQSGRLAVVGRRCDVDERSGHHRSRAKAKRPRQDRRPRLLDQSVVRSPCVTICSHAASRPTARDQVRGKEQRRPAGNRPGASAHTVPTRTKRWRQHDADRHASGCGRRIGAWPRRRANACECAETRRQKVQDGGADLARISRLNS